MKMAQALNLRKKIETDQTTAVRAAQAVAFRFPEDPEPAQGPGVILDILIRNGEKWIALIQAINKSNATTMLPNGLTVQAAIDKRNVLA
jgi:hypothetical protein